MWIVRVALNRPYTFIVAALLIAVLGVVSIRRMAVDIFPDINIPVVSVIWTYTGLSAQEMERRVVTVSERAFTTTVNDIEHIESRSLNGVAIIKVYFQPGAKIEAGIAQLTSICGSITRILPPGMTPPGIVSYSASSVPIIQATLRSDSLTEQQLNDYAANFIRTGLATVQGASVPLPYGGKPRQIRVDLDPDAMYARGITATDVSAAVAAQNLILPTGTAKIGGREYNVKLNSSPDAIEQLNELPVKQVGGTTVYIRDVGHVHDGYQVQTNVVRQDGKRGSFLTVLKNGSASTLDIIERVKTALPGIEATLPEALKISLLFDQSLFVKASITGVIREAALAGLLTAAMILLFLGSWRSTLMVALSIPLSILTSITVLGLFGYTLNIMTLGGLALAVGILVDDATVTIENVNRTLADEKTDVLHAILNGVAQIATPALVSTFCICIVFVPVFLLDGVAGYLFAPLALAVVCAMLASYVLSRTFVPTLMRYWLPKEAALYQPTADGQPAPQGDWFWRLHSRFDRAFERFRDRYQAVLTEAVAHRRGVLIGFGLFFVGSLGLYPFIGEDFFPSVDAGEFRLHVSAPPGSRIEETERTFARIETLIRQTIPKEELNLILDNIGLPYSGINLALSDNVSIGPADGEILVALNENHRPTAYYTDLIRRKLKRAFPDVNFYYQPADIVTQILNFGLPAPIDIQLVGKNQPDNLRIARAIQRRVAQIPGAVDVNLAQVLDVPQFNVTVDRSRAEGVGLTQRDVATNLLISLSSSSQTSPSYWLDPKSGVSYGVALQTPTYKVASLEDLTHTPIAVAGRAPQLLTNVSTVGRGTTPGIVTHYNVQPTLDIYASVQKQDLGSVAKAINAILDEYRPQLKRGNTLTVRGQVQSMTQAFTGLKTGLLFAILLVYFLLVINFQSWLDPFIIIMALPGALSGILWMLFVSQTTLSVPSLMGAIMCMGVATANSVLLVSFANEQRLGDNPMAADEAAVAAGYTRLRPVLMTALTMMIGMIPMALGLGEGGEQNAPLGRAVIGGLLVATVTTLLFVPVLYSLLRQKSVQPIEEV